jgi:hypothetical protein
MDIYGALINHGPLGIMSAASLLALYKVWKDNRRLVNKVIELSTSSIQSEMQVAKALEGLEAWYKEWPRFMRILNDFDGVARNVQHLLTNFKVAQILQPNDAPPVDNQPTNEFPPVDELDGATVRTQAPVFLADETTPPNYQGG